MNILNIILTIWAATCLIAAALVIAASVMRCPKCGEWHEEDDCQNNR